MERNKQRISELSKEQLKALALNGEIILATEAGLQSLIETIDKTKDEVSLLQRKLGESASDNPDLPENTEFKEIKTRLQFVIPKTLSDLRKRLGITIPYSEAGQGNIKFGAVIEAVMKYPDVEKEEEEKFILLGPLEATYRRNEYLASVLSYMTPLGRALWGQPDCAGAIYQVKTPGGNIECVIKKVNAE